MLKKGSAGSFLILVVIMLIIGTLSIFISTQMTYSKEDVDVKIEGLYSELENKADAPGCEIIEIESSRHLGKTDTEICSQIDKEPRLKINYFHLMIYSGEPLAVMAGGTCDDSRLISDEYITETTTSNLGQTYIESSIYYDSECTRVGTDGSARRKVLESTQILCC
jgi:hypothetical protein